MNMYDTFTYADVQCNATQGEGGNDHLIKKNVRVLMSISLTNKVIDIGKGQYRYKLPLILEVYLVRYHFGALLLF